MPTADRRAFVPWAIHDFLRQDYDDRELIIVDDGADAIDDLVPPDNRITYIRLEGKHTVGAKRNIACERARGEFIAHWDDDDWHAPRRIGVQVRALEDGRVGVVGLREPLFYEPSTGRAWRYGYRGPRAWLSGSSLCYRRDVWQQRPFAEVDVGEDSRFVLAARRWGIRSLADQTIHVGIIHDRNVSPKQTAGPLWHPVSPAAIHDVLGDDLQRYARPVSRAPSSSLPTDSAQPPTLAERTIPMFTVARAADLELPEFRAFRAGRQLPWMRRWEQPFALYQAQLGETMAVLDCTVNPAGFEAALSALYPHVAYRHWKPITGGAYAPPVGLPDAAFDRVFCLNTLEHLPTDERRELLADIATKLKPGGQLLFTSDFYFDSSWQDPAFLDAGVMRTDRSEFVNGYNKVTFKDLKALCAEVGLNPASDVSAVDPAEGDEELYRNVPPHVHAAIGGIFVKPRGTARIQPAAARRRIVLALLTWNTRDVSLDSVAAHAREARMLARLGHDVSICVCDNGSDDGTADALRSLDATLDVEHRFILNDRNRGNSIARNQILDYVAEWRADYVLLMDGDIEIVPFSSFAMLRYMESQGSRLGCIGPHSWGQTNVRAKASDSVFAIQPSQVTTTNVVAWTQYGLFRKEVFEAGVRFDERSPFDGAGWGFEDNDLVFQMDVKGFLSQYFSGLTYLHRDARSSLRIMRARGIDARRLYDERKRYVLEKWSAVERIAKGPLVDVGNAFLP